MLEPKLRFPVECCPHEARRLPRGDSPRPVGRGGPSPSPAAEAGPPNRRSGRLAESLRVGRTDPPVDMPA